MFKNRPLAALAFYLLGYAWLIASVFSAWTILVIMFLHALALCSFICGSILLSKHYLALPLPESKPSPSARYLHWSALVTYVIPYSNFWLPQLLWIKNRGQQNYESQAINVFNFQLSIGLYLLAAMMLSIVIIGIPIAALLFLAHFILTVYAGFIANNKTIPTYPGSLNIVGPKAYVRQKKNPTENK